MVEVYTRKTSMFEVCIVSGHGVVEREMGRRANQAADTSSMSDWFGAQVAELLVARTPSCCRIVSDKLIRVFTHVFASCVTSPSPLPACVSTRTVRL